MKISQLNQIKKVANRNKHMPQLAGRVHVYSKDGALVLEATDLENFPAIVTVAESTEGSGGVVDVESLITAYKASDKKGAFRLDEDSLIVGDIEIPLTPYDEDVWPDREVITQGEHETGSIELEALYHAHQHISKDDARKVLHGVYISEEDNTVVATNGKTLAITPNDGSFEGENVILDTSNSMFTFLGHKGSAFLVRQTSTKKPWFSMSVCNNAGEAFIWAGKIIAGKYPNYKQVVPNKKDSNKASVTFPDGLKASLSKGRTSEDMITITENACILEDSITLKFDGADAPNFDGEEMLLRQQDLYKILRVHGNAVTVYHRDLGTSIPLPVLVESETTQTASVVVPLRDRSKPDKE